MKIHIAYNDREVNKILCGRSFLKVHSYWHHMVLDVRIKSSKDWCKVCKEMYNTNFVGERKLR